MDLTNLEDIPCRQYLIGTEITPAMTQGIASNYARTIQTNAIKCYSVCPCIITYHTSQLLRCLLHKEYLSN